MLYRVPQARTLPAPGQTADNYIVINNEMNYHLVDPALVPSTRTRCSPAAWSADTRRE